MTVVTTMTKFRSRPYQVAASTYLFMRRRNQAQGAIFRSVQRLATSAHFRFRPLSGCSLSFEPNGTRLCLLFCRFDGSICHTCSLFSFWTWWFFARKRALPMIQPLLKLLHAQNFAFDGCVKSTLCLPSAQDYAQANVTGSRTMVGWTPRRSPSHGTIQFGNISLQ